ncbi:hypothetical protein [Sandaracinobacter sp.]|jgi:hypothetical protein|uniref:hypothetical protein n=1 Tax=Sandaracinobacter sp. TaxID=2487581 RepID=UPI0035AF288B
MTRKPTLDDALAAWGTTDPLTAGDSGALDRILKHADAVAAPSPASRLRWWALGGAVAASAAIALVVAPSIGVSQRQDAAGEAGAQPVILADASGSESAAFALLYTPTTEEEYQL